MAETLKEMLTTKLLSPREVKTPNPISELPALLRIDRFLEIKMAASKINKVEESVENDE